MDSRRGRQLLLRSVGVSLILAACTRGTPTTNSLAATSSAAPAPAHAVEPAWTGDTSGFTSPPVVNGRVVYVPSEEGGLYAFPSSCAAICSPAWIGNTGPIAVGSQSLNWNPNKPTVAGGSIYVRSKAPHPKVYAFPTSCTESGATCDSTWTAPTATPSDATRDDFYLSPVIAGDTVYIGTFGRGLIALSTSCVGTCDPKWSSSINGLWPPVIQGHTVFQQTQDRLYALDVRTGDVIWQSARAPKGFLSEPTLARGMVFITLRSNRGSAPALYAFPQRCPGLCHPLWTASVPDLYVDGAVVHGDRVYFGTETATGTGVGHVYGFPLHCGTDQGACKPVWTAKTSGEIGFFDVAFSGDVVIATSWEQSEMEAFPLNCGQPTCARLWSFQGTDPDHSFYPITISNGVVYEADRTGHLYALPVACRSDGGTCEPSWVWTSPDALTTPAVIPGKLFTTSSSGHVYAFDLP